MAVRFVVSRAGGGKTYHCLEAVRRELRVSATDGPRLVLLVPEQAALQTERALIETPDIAGYSRCEVLSFRRLAFRVLLEVGASGTREVSATSRLMVLRYLLERRRTGRGRLGVFGRVADRGGFVRKLADQFVELFYQGIEPDDLETQAAELAESNPSLAAKLRDVHSLYGDYLAYLADGRIDVDQYLDRARQHIDEVAPLRGAHVWVDGFAIFSRQEEHLLTALARQATNLDITMLVDPASPALTGNFGLTGEGYAPDDMDRLFVQVEETVGRLSRAFSDASITVESPLKLAARQDRPAALARLEQRLFDAPPAEVRRGRADADAPVRVIEAANRRVEVDAAVAEIQRLVRRREDPLRYRDIAVIVRQMETYHDLLSAAFCAHEIPYFLDRRRPMGHHPLVELMRVLPRVCAEDLAIRPVRVLLKTGLVPLSTEDADRLENYVLAHGIRSRRIWLGEPWRFRRGLSTVHKDDELPAIEQVTLEQVHEARERLMTPLRPLIEMSARGASRTGREWAEALFRCLEALGVPERLAGWARRAEEDGRLDEAEEHRHLWRDVVALLDEFTDALGEQAMSIRRFGEVLDTGLETFALGLAPPSLDQVLVGSVERSRHPEIRAAIVLGFNEGMFPSISSDRGVFNERETAALRAGGLELGRAREMMLDTERLLAYIAATRPRELLRISYAVADETSRALTPSPYLAYILGALDDVVVETAADPIERRALWNIGTAGALSARLALELSRRGPVDADPPELRGRWNALYDWARSDGGCRRMLGRALAALATTEDPALDAAAVNALYGDDRPWSVSQLESAAVCPFRHFARYGLGLSEREEFKLDALDLGRLHHRILEQLLSQLIAEGKRLSDIDDEELQARLVSATDAETDKLDEELLLEHARSRYLHTRSTHDLGRAAAAHKQLGAAGQFKPRATEIPFGFPTLKNSLPALEIDTPGGRHVRIRGFVDRVDVAEEATGLLAMIVDYKRGAERKLNLTKVLAGLELQLLTYLLVIREHGAALFSSPILPAGAFYFNIKPRYESVDHPSQARAAKGGLSKTYQPRGILNIAHAQALDVQLRAGASSSVFNVRLKKDGALGYVDRSDGVDSEQLDGLLTESRRALGALADQILDGHIEVHPSCISNDSLPCNWCPLGAVCRFEPETGRTRMIQALSRAEALSRIDDRS